MRFQVYGLGARCTKEYGERVRQWPYRDDPQMPRFPSHGGMSERYGGAEARPEAAAGAMKAALAAKRRRKANY